MSLIIEDYMDRMIEAIEKHPVFAESREQGIAVITEEYLELVRAVNDHENTGRVKSEALGLAVTALRFYKMEKEKQNENRPD